MIRAAITPGIQPAQVRSNTIRKDPQIIVQIVFFVHKNMPFCGRNSVFHAVVHKKRQFCGQRHLPILHGVWMMRNLGDFRGCRCELPDAVLEIRLHVAPSVVWTGMAFQSWQHYLLFIVQHFHEHLVAVI